MKEKNYLSEAFQALKVLDLNEDTFDITDDGIEQAQNFMDYEDEVENVIDPLAETEEDLQDSYIGKAILDCKICQSKIYKDPSEVVIDEEENLANIGEICPYCQSTDGFKVIGQVAEYNPNASEDDVKVEVEPKEEKEEDDEDDEEEKVEEGLKDTKTACTKKEDCKDEDCKNECVKEDLNNVQIETDNERITVSSEPKEQTSGEEAIAPLSADVEASFKTENSDEEETEPEYQDVDIDEFEEKDFDELGEKYLRKVYENVKSYRTTKGSTKGNTLKLEGVITFKSGKQAKTNFIFEAKSITKSGKLKFLGENTQFAKGKRAFVLTGTNNKGKLMVESLNYNYTAKDAKTGKSQRLYGRVSKR